MAESETLQQNAPAAAINTDNTPEHMIPKSRFDEINNRLKQLEKEKAESDRVANEFSRKTAEEQGKYKELYEQVNGKLATLGEKAQAVDKYQGVISKMLDNQKKDLPAHILTLLDRLDPADQLEWIAENQAAIKQPQVSPDVQPKAGAASFNPVGTKATLTDRERIASLNRARGVTSPFG